MATALHKKQDQDTSQIDRRIMLICALATGTASRKNLTQADYDEIIRSADEMLKRTS